MPLDQINQLYQTTPWLVKLVCGGHAYPLYLSERRGGLVVSHCSSNTSARGIEAEPLSREDLDEILIPAIVYIFGCPSKDNVSSHLLALPRSIDCQAFAQSPFGFRRKKI